MLLINFQLGARNREIPGAGCFHLRGGFNIRWKRLVINAMNAAMSENSSNVRTVICHCHCAGLVHV